MFSFRIYLLPLTISALYLGLLSSCSLAPFKPDSIKAGDYEKVFRYADWMAQREWKNKKLPALSVAIVDDQAIVWQQNYGYSDREKKLAANSDTLYRVGSISKVFTAMAALILVDQSKMELDQPLQNYLPNFNIGAREDLQASEKQVTPRNILTHHSGLPSDFVKASWSSHPLDADSLLQQLQHEYLAANANLILAYSNLGYTLLGHAIAHVSSQSFSQYMQDNLLTPMGMNRSAFVPFAPQTDNLAVPYRDDKRQTLLGTSSLGAGGLWSSVNDLSRFLSTLFRHGNTKTGTLLNAEMFQSLFTPQNRGVDLDFDMKIGQAWFLHETTQSNVIMAEHGGGTIGFRTLIKLIPQSKIGVIVLCNSSASGDSVNKIGDKMLKLYYQAKTGHKLQLKKYQRATTATNHKPPFDLVGHYASGAGLVSIVKNGADYSIEVLGRHFDLEAQDDGSYQLRYYVLGFIPWPLQHLNGMLIKPELVADRKILTILQHGSQKLVAEKISPYTIPPRWLEWLGNLEIINPDEIGTIKNLRLSQRDGWLLARFQSDLGIPNNHDILLQPINDQLAVIAGIGRGQGSAIQIIEQDGKKYLRFSGFMLQKQQKP